MLECHCGMAYIGQTSRMIKIRVNKHRSSIRTYKEHNDEHLEREHKHEETTVTRKKKLNRHNVCDLCWTIIEMVHGDNKHQIK